MLISVLVAATAAMINAELNFADHGDVMRAGLIGVRDVVFKPSKYIRHPSTSPCLPSRSREHGRQVK